MIKVYYVTFRHEVVNVNLKNKPDWFLQRNPFGKVPVLEQDDKIVYESLICSDYLDQTYPGNKLTPDDPYRLAQDKILVEHFDKVKTSVTSFSDRKYR